MTLMVTDDSVLLIGGRISRTQLNGSIELSRSTLTVCMDGSIFCMDDLGNLHDMFITLVAAIGRL